MKKHKKRIGFRNLIVMVSFVTVFIIFIEFITDNSRAFGIAFLFFFVNYLVIALHERKYGKKNFPYKPYKSKEKTAKRILIGMLAGLHYLFFIGSYNHKKYNTQVGYPETLECVFGNISQMVILFAYLFISIITFKLVGYYALLFMVIPIITTTLSIIKNHSKK